MYLHRVGVEVGVWSVVSLGAVLEKLLISLVFLEALVEPLGLPLPFLVRWGFLSGLDRGLLEFFTLCH